MYPIMFQQLFARVGFAWSVRFSGFLSLICCCIAVCTVTSFREPVRHSAPLLNSNIFRDIPFMLVVVGSIFVCLGESRHSVAPTELTHEFSRALHPILLYCGLCS